MSNNSNDINTGEDFGDVDSLNEALSQADGNSSYSAGESCGGDIKTHIKDVLAALFSVGAGLGCRDTQYALLEVAERARVENNLAHYTPHLSSVVDEAMRELGAELAEVKKQFQDYQDAQAQKYLETMDTSRMTKN